MSALSQVNNAFKILVKPPPPPPFFSLTIAGYNSYGQLGDDSTVNRNVPTAISTRTVATWKHVAAAWDHSCGIAASTHKGYCWGKSNRIRVLTKYDLLVPYTKKEVLTCFVSFPVHIGSNSHGQLGVDRGTYPSSSVPVAIDFDSTWEQLTSSYIFSCGIATNRSGYCWGMLFLLY